MRALTKCANYDEPFSMMVRTKSLKINHKKSEANNLFCIYPDFYDRVIFFFLILRFKKLSTYCVTIFYVYAQKRGEKRGE